MIELTVFDEKKRRNVKAGEYNPETKTFIKKVKKTHFMRMLEAYGIQELVLDRLATKRCENIVIKAPGVTYSSKLWDWERGDIKTLNYGHGRQRFLPIRHMLATQTTRNK